MSRYLGPIFKKSRKLNFSILENNKEFKKRKFSSNKKRWKKKSGFAIQLEEKQRLRYLYHLGEKQLRNTFKKILKKEGIQSQNLVIELEKRLDNLVYRIGFASTRKASRQMVNHGHIMVNNRKVDIASYIVKVNDIISLKKFKNKIYLENIVTNIKDSKELDFLTVDKVNLSAKLNKEPDVETLNLNINGSLVVEYYNRFT